MWKDYKLFRKYHRPTVDGGEAETRCQGQIARAQGMDIRGAEVVTVFGNRPHYGKVVNQQPGVIYRAPGAPVTIWMVQYEDGDEFDLPADEIEEGIRNLAAAPLSREIKIPNDWGEAGRPGDVFGREHDLELDLPEEQPGERGVEPVAGDGAEDEAQYSIDSDESDYSSEEDDLYIDPKNEVYLETKICAITGVNVFSHIYRHIADRKEGASNSSIIDNFGLQMESFGVQLPKTWGKVVSLFQV